MKTIYVYTGDHRSYGLSPDLWEGNVIPVEVSDDFQGGAKQYDADTGMWTDDPEAPVDYTAAASLQVQQLVDSAMSSVSVIQLKLQAGRALTEAERTKLNAVLDYIDAVSAVDISTAPDITLPELVL